MMNIERFQKLAGIITEAKPLTVAPVVSQPVSNTNPPKDRKSAAVLTIIKDFSDQKANFLRIRDAKKVEELFDAVINELDSKFLESSAFRAGLRAIYVKYYTPGKKDNNLI